MNNKSANRGLLRLLVFVFIALIAGIGLYVTNYYSLIPCKTYTAEDFGIVTVYSGVDYNNNGIDDYTDILLEAKKDAENRPIYDGAYYSGGYPPVDIVIFGDDKHIGIVSDKRNSMGQSYIIHNYGQPKREQDFLKHSQVTGHYRFDASMIPEDIIVKWSHAMGTVPVAEH